MVRVLVHHHRFIFSVNGIANRAMPISVLFIVSSFRTGMSNFQHAANQNYTCLFPSVVSLVKR